MILVWMIFPSRAFAPYQVYCNRASASGGLSSPITEPIVSGEIHDSVGPHRL
jgi:hypothetical protein